tara:strand:- start:9228 stop:9719 length:492 start_codon:yes stop_codon:yes gene_type:complete
MAFLKARLIIQSAQKARIFILAFCCIWPCFAFDIEQALQKTFPKCRLELKTQSAADQSQIYPWFHGKCEKHDSIAYVRQELVRTHPMVLVKKVTKAQDSTWHVIRFDEPKKYQPTQEWLVAQAKKFGLGQNVDALSGATMTRRAVINAFEQIKKVEQLVPELL